MARINQALLDRLTKKLGISKSRLYALIQKKSNQHHVKRHVGALLLAGENGISVQKYADDADLSEMRGVPHHTPAVTAAAAASPARSAPKKKTGKVPKTKENTVFVIHGRDLKLRDSMYEFLGALGLKPQEWGHAIRVASRGQGGNPYVNDVVTKIMEQAQAVVVILSPDDESKLKDQFIGKHERQTEGKLRGQARQNVIFETGIALGVHHKKTVIVRIGDVKSFTDIGGMHIPRLSNDEHSRHDLANRLADLGCDIDRSGDHWLRAGDFTPTAASKRAVKKTGSKQPMKKTRWR
jgi:predicted nucleotide-binding protein